MDNRDWAQIRRRLQSPPRTSARTPTPPRRSRKNFQRRERSEKSCAVSRRERLRRPSRLPHRRTTRILALGILGIRNVAARFTSTASRARAFHFRRRSRASRAVLGPNAFAVRGLFFNKTSDSNWKVAWHQDLTIALKERRDTPGFTAWSVKHGVVHVQPPVEILEHMLAIRIHLDDSAEDNGPLRCIPGSHLHGRLTTEQIAALDKTSAATCLAPAGTRASHAPARSARVVQLHVSPATTRSPPRIRLNGFAQRIELARKSLSSRSGWLLVFRKTFCN